MDLQAKKLSTTKASGQSRTTPIVNLQRDAGQVVLKGYENKRAFGFLIDEKTGWMTVAVARRDVAVTVFGACTPRPARRMSMKIKSVVIAGLLLVFAFGAVVAQQKSLSSTLGVYVFPNGGQDASTQSKDEGECYTWAVQQAGVDPFHSRTRPRRSKLRPKPAPRRRSRRARARAPEAP